MPTYFVAPTGNDSNPGTQGLPWKSINFATNNVNQLRPGDTVFIAPGTYAENVVQRVQGAIGAPVTFAALDKNNPPVISGPALSRQWYIEDLSYVVIDGLKFANYTCGGLHIRAQNANVVDVTITNCTFENQSNSDSCAGFRHVINAGTRIPTLEIRNLTISHNTIRNVTTGRPDSYDENLTLYGNVHHSRIEYNKIINGSYIGIDTIGYRTPGGLNYGQPHHIIIRGNHINGIKSTNIPGVGVQPGIGIYTDGPLGYYVIEDNVIQGATGIYINSEPYAWNNSQMVEPRHVIVRRNYVNIPDGTGLYGIALGIGALGQSSCYARLLKSAAVHNTIYFSRRAGFVNILLCGEQLAWKNNIFVNLSTTSPIFNMFLNVANPLGWELDGNLYHSALPSTAYYWKNGAYFSLPAFQSASGQDRSSLTGDPAFINAQNGDFRLSENSVCVERGVVLTRATLAGTNSNVMRVADVKYFSDGLGIQGVAGDVIRIGQGESAATAVVIGIDYDNNVLTLDRTLSWDAGAGVSYNYGGSAPDIGAYETSLSRPDVGPVPPTAEQNPLVGVTYQVSSPADSASATLDEERLWGLGGEQLFGDRDEADFDYVTGFRFVLGADMPAGSRVAQAYLRFCAYSAEGSDWNLSISAEVSADAAQFTTAEDFHQRSRTTAKVTWTPSEWQPTNRYNSPDVSAILQELIDEFDGLRAGDAVVFFVEDAEPGFQAQRLLRAFGFGESPDNAPKLFVDVVGPADELQNLPVASGADDAFRSSTAFSLNEGLYVGDFTAEHFDYGSGVRFVLEQDLPPESVVWDCRLLVRANDPVGSQWSMRINGENDENPGEFTTKEDFDSRVRTSTTVFWSPPIWTSGVWLSSPNLAQIVQQLVETYGGLSAGHALVFFVSGEQEGFQSPSIARMYSFDDDAESAPRLYLKYRTLDDEEQAARRPIEMGLYAGLRMGLSS